MEWLLVVWSLESNTYGGWARKPEIHGPFSSAASCQHAGEISILRATGWTSRKNALDAPVGPSSSRFFECHFLGQQEINQ